jgi:hypothetical protein
LISNSRPEAVTQFWCPSRLIPGQLTGTTRPLGRPAPLARASSYRVGSFLFLFWDRDAKFTGGSEGDR